MHMHTKEMKNKPWWVVRTEYYSTNVLAHQKNEEQVIMSRPYRVLQY